MRRRSLSSFCGCTPGATIFYQRAQQVAATTADHLDYVAHALRGWATFTDAGLASAKPFEVAARIEAAADLMEQVHQLLDDRSVVPAAPAVLAGAALEEVLRGLVARSGAPVKGKAGLQSYAEALKVKGLIDKAAVMDVISIAASRNKAAHGDFEDVTAERVRLMADQAVNSNVGSRPSSATAKSHRMPWNRTRRVEPGVIRAASMNGTSAAAWLSMADP